jgi:protein SCO1/2
MLLAFSGCISRNEKIEEKQLPYYNSPNFTPIFLSKDEQLAQKITHQIANFSFTDQAGKTITQKDIENKIHVADFVFTSCGSICPVMTEHMRLVSNAFEKNPNVTLLSYSVTPWVDDVKRLNIYTKIHQINNPNWHFLTGNKADIYNLARQSYFAEEDLGFTKDSKKFLHTEHILLIDKNKRIRGIYNGTLELEMNQLIKDIQTLLKEG